MWKKYWKKYWKITAAAVFLTAAGLCYGGSRLRDGEVRLEEWDRAAAAAVLGTSENGGPVGNQVAETSGNTGDQASGSQNSAGNLAVSGQGGANDSADVPGTESAAAEAETRAAGIFVHICGAVKNPGVYELEEDSRVFEAVNAAGGFTDGAAEAFLNLAARVSDGMKIVVLSEAEVEALTEEERLAFEKTAGGVVSGGGATGGTGIENGVDTDRVPAESDGLINLNTATKQELMTLNGIGESRAEAIIQYRQESGGFSRIEDVMKVPGIKDAAFQKIKDRIKV